MSHTADPTDPEIINNSDLILLGKYYNRFCPVYNLLTCFEYDAAGTGLLAKTVESTNRRLPLNSEDPCLGNSTALDYDEYGNLESVINSRFYGQPTPPTAYFNIDAAGRVLTVTNELGHDITTTYDAFNMPRTRTDELGNVTTWTYDQKGNLKTITDANRTAVDLPETGCARRRHL